MLETLIIIVLSACGIASIITRPGPGPTNYLRRAIVKRWPESPINYLLACRFCCATWSALAGGVIGWCATGDVRLLTACLIAPFVIQLHESTSGMIQTIVSSCAGCSGKSDSKQGGSKTEGAKA